MWKTPLIIVEPDGHEYYSRGTSERTTNPLRYPLRRYLRLDYLAQVVLKGIPPLSLSQMRRLVGEDGPVISCSNCQRPFQPVWWRDITDPKFLELLEMGWSFDEALEDVKKDMLIFGAFYLNPDLESGKTSQILNEDYRGYCGAPYFYDIRINQYLPAHGCLNMAKERHPKKYRGKALGIIEEELALINEKLARQVRETNSKSRLERFTKKLEVTKQVMGFAR